MKTRHDLIVFWSQLEMVTLLTKYVPVNEKRKTKTDNSCIVISHKIM